jgi:carbon monoxide dehydrogenase subunit G
MELTQSRAIGAPAQAVWAALNDPAVLKSCIPGCEALERVSDTELRAVIATRIGPVQARFNGRVQLADIVAPTGYTLRFEGQGGAAGFASGEARVSLAATGENATTLTYTATARVGGKIAQLGSRLVDGAAAKLAEDFFTCFAERLAPPPAEIATAAPAASTPVGGTSGRHWVRYAALAGIILVLIVLYLYRHR